MAAKILLSEKQHEILQIVVKSATAWLRLIQRARIILLSFERLRNDGIAKEGRPQSEAGRTVAQALEAVI